MSDVAIRAEALSKRYRIGFREDLPDTLLGALTSWAKSPLRSYRRLRALARFDGDGADESVIWALRDVSFEVKRGEVLGVIGRNGAGKSTLLKVLSRITEPTSGLVDVYGRVASLLEVGTGFHPELTGRENVYLNGTVLGMDKRYIDRRFDEIVEFAGVERFLDTPVKRYSSGMYLRLAFAVAAHLEPEILVIDEVLAVGDAEFQRRCLGKMQDVARGGRTVIFVSHDMSAVQRLCHRTMLLADGRILCDGDTRTVVGRYLTAADGVAEHEDLATFPREGALGEQLRITGCALSGADGERTRQLRFGEPFGVTVDATAEHDLSGLSILVGIEATRGHRVATIASEDEGVLFSTTRGRSLTASARFSDLRLTPGTYWLTLAVRNGRQGLDQVIRVHRFEVVQSTYGELHPHSGAWGDVHASAHWQLLTAGRRPQHA